MWNSIKRGPVLGLLFASTVCGGPCSANDASIPSRDWVETSSGAIFSKEVALAGRVCKTLRNCWTPSTTDIKTMEKDLSAFLMTSKVMWASKISKNLASYKRKYYGFKRGGDRYIRVNGLCQLYWKPQSSQFASPDRPTTDMGPCYFLVDYNVQRRTFSNFYIDGD